MTKFVAINPRTSTVVMNRGGVFVLINTETKDVVQTSTEFIMSTAKGWEDPKHPPSDVWIELAEAATTSLSIDDSAQSSTSLRVFRVPKNIQKNSKLFNSETTTLETIHNYFIGDHSDDLVSEWVDKIVSKFPIEGSITASGFTPEPSSMYYGRVAEPNTTKCDAMYAHNENDEWAERRDGSWVPVEENPIESYSLLLLDPESATALANRLDNPDILEGQTLELAVLNPQESGLFFSAESEIDYEFLDMLFDVYDSTERSINAQKQVRGPGGRFMPNPGGGESSSDKPKARLSVSLPIIPNISERIDQYLEDVKKQRENSSDKSSTRTPSKEKKKKPEFAVTAEQSGAPTSDVAPLYIALVDNIDTDAVLDLVSLVPPAQGTQGDVSAWKRANGQWVAAPEILAQLRGSTPPSCVEISDTAVLKGIIEQVDKSTHEEVEEQPAPGQTEISAEGAPTPNSSQPKMAPVEMKKSNFNNFNIDTENIEELSARGYAFGDGTLLIRNSIELREAISKADSFDKQLHCIKRARALNRYDLIPKHWTHTEAAIEEDLWGPYGELTPLTAAGGLDRNRGNAERLRHYWTRGPGGAKIMWGTPRDWTRCVSYLSKYLGPRAKGYCALRHKEQNGYWPGDRRNK